MRAQDAQRMAQFIAWGPVVFQVAYIMVKWGVFQLLSDHREGLSIADVAREKQITKYAAQILLEGSLVSGTVYLKDGRFLMDDKMAIANMNFVQDVNYLGLFSLEDALKNGRPEGLKVFGNWKTIYEGLSSLPAQVQKSWFGFDHFYSDHSFDEALQVVFERHPRSILDVGGNTGRWAMQCVGHDPDVQVTIMDLPQQIGLMRKATAGCPGSERIGSYAADLLDPATEFPRGFDAVWMSQFLDCFSEEQVVSILSLLSVAMKPDTRLYIMETLWDAQQYETASFCLAMTSVYFTAMANGNSKMFYSEDLYAMIDKAGLKVADVKKGLGLGHSIIICEKK